MQDIVEADMSTMASGFSQRIFCQIVSPLNSKISLKKQLIQISFTIKHAFKTIKKDIRELKQ